MSPPLCLLSSSRFLAADFSGEPLLLRHRRTRRSTLKIPETELTPLMPRVALIPRPLLPLVTSSNLPRGASPSAPLELCLPPPLPCDLIRLKSRGGASALPCSKHQSDATRLFLIHALFLFPLLCRRREGGSSLRPIFYVSLSFFSPLFSTSWLQPPVTTGSVGSQDAAWRARQLGGFNLNLRDLLSTSSSRRQPVGHDCTLARRRPCRTIGLNLHPCGQSSHT